MAQKLHISTYYLAPVTVSRIVKTIVGTFLDLSTVAKNKLEFNDVPLLGDCILNEKLFNYSPI